MNLLLPLLVALAVLVIYLLRTPPRPMVIPSSYLWQKLAERARPLRERLRWILSLLLAMTIGCSMAWALIKSPLFGGGRGETALAIVIDNSTSMAALRVDGGTRLEEALIVARRAINANSGPVLIADTAGHIESLEYADKERAEDLLSGIEIDFSQKHRYPAIPDPDSGSIAKVVFLTDGVLPLSAPSQKSVDPGLDTAATDNDGPTVLSVFETAVNVGITAFDTRRAPDGKLYAYIELVHAADHSSDVQLTVSEASATRLERKLTLGANELWSGVIDVTGWASPLSAEVRLTAGRDALAADNFAWRLVSEEEPTRILLLSDRPEGLVTLLRSTSPGVIVQTLSTTQLYSQQSAPGFWDDFDLLVADRTAPKDQPPIASWWITPPDTSYLPRRNGSVTLQALPEVLQAKTDGRAVEPSNDLGHFELTASSLDDLDIKQVQKVDLSSAFGSNKARDVQVLAQAGGHPLLITWQDRTPQLLQTFDMPDRDFARSPSIPVLAVNLIAGLKRREANTTPGVFFVTRPIGAVISLARATSSEEEAQAHSPIPHNPVDVNSEQALPSSVSFRSPGLYRLRYTTATEESEAEYLDIAVNLTSRTASQINQPRSGLSPAESTKTSAEVPSSGNVPWRLLILLALALGVLEWFTFNRKVTI